MKAIILVAGYATRLYPLTLNIPKALLPINGKPIIDYIVDDINTIDEIDQIYVVSNHKFFGHFDKWSSVVKSRIPISVLDDGTDTEETRRGAIGDIYFTLEITGIDDDLMIIAGDNFNTFKLKEYFDYFKKVKKDCVCALEINDKDQLKGFAVATVDENNKILSLVEKPEKPESNLGVFATYFYLRETLPYFKKYLAAGNKSDAPGYFPQWLHSRKDIYAYKMKGESYDIGTPEMYEKVNRLFSEE